MCNKNSRRESTGGNPSAGIAENLDAPFRALRNRLRETWHVLFKM
jgi:hypothetical protein